MITSVLVTTLDGRELFVKHYATHSETDWKTVIPDLIRLQAETMPSGNGSFAIVDDNYVISFQAGADMLVFTASTTETSELELAGVCKTIRSLIESSCGKKEMRSTVLVDPSIYSTFVLAMDEYIFNGCVQFESADEVISRLKLNF